MSAHESKLKAYQVEAVFDEFFKSNVFTKEQSFRYRIKRTIVICEDEILEEHLFKGLENRKRKLIEINAKAINPKDVYVSSNAYKILLAN